ncbi:MAG: zinc ribbon domain-containing protein [Desulfobacteraceae bacterium]|nr:zinc ribbon domain-containing protein [Desulfobacteraceae bacterium]
MAFETKEELLQKYMEMDKPQCPHCKTDMTLWEVPQFAFGDGLGWGTPYLFVCYNDKCPSYDKGWEHLQESMEAAASYRCIQEPGTDNFEYMPVFSAMGGKGQELNDAALIEQEARKEAAKKGFSVLTDYYIAKEWDEILKMLLDSQWPGKVRLKAAEMVEELAEVEAIEHLINHKFPPVLQKRVDKAVEQLHERFFTKECPYCAGIIKKRAKVCKHCNKDL